MGLLILLVGLLNFFHFLTGSYFNRTKEFSVMKVNGCSGGQLFTLLFVQSLLVVLAASLLMLWGIEVTDGRLDYSVEFMSMTFSKSLLMRHAVQYIGLLVLLCGYLPGGHTAHPPHIGAGRTWRRPAQASEPSGRNFMLGVQFFLCWLFVALSAALYLQSEKTSDTCCTPSPCRKKLPSSASRWITPA